jgi:hypothetical protein
VPNDADMGTIGEIPSWVGFRVEDPDGVPLGRVEAVPVVVRAGLPVRPELLVRLADGARVSVPLAGAHRRAGAVRIATALEIDAARVRAPSLT